jgi:hypothetical protein
MVCSTQVAHRLWEGGLFKGGVYVVRLRGKSDPMGVLDAFMQAFYITDHEHALRLFKAQACHSPSPVSLGVKIKADF